VFFLTLDETGKVIRRFGYPIEAGQIRIVPERQEVSFLSYGHRDVLSVYRVNYVVEALPPLQRMAALPEQTSAADLSVDGQWVAYAVPVERDKDDEKGGWEVRIQPVERGASPTDPIRLADVAQIAWFSDGKRLLLLGRDGSLHTWTIPESQLAPLDLPLETEDGERLHPESITVSPDGTRLAFRAGYGVYVINLDGRELRRLTPLSFFEESETEGGA
jgi:WD40 repeat protein